MGKNRIVVLLLLLVITVHAQETPLSFKQVDSTSYSLYLKQDWKSVIDLGKKSQKAGIDFYYLKVRMGVAYFKVEKMLSAVKMFEEAYAVNPSDIFVQEYLYWAYVYSGLNLESQLFYQKMAQTVKDSVKLKLPVVSAIDVGFVATNNSDYDDMLTSVGDSDDGESRSFPDKYQLYTLGLNHPLSKGINLYHRVTYMPIESNYQLNSSGEVENTSYEGEEIRYYADATFALGNKWYLDMYLDLIFGSYDDLTTQTTVGNGNGNGNGSGVRYKYDEENYTDYVFGASITKAMYFTRNTVNVSYSNLNNADQFQVGYTILIYPLGSAYFVPFASVQYQNESKNSNSRFIFSGGISAGIKDFNITGFGNFGDTHNFNSNNGSLIYNQSATTTNEYGAILQVYLKKAIIKVGYSYMEMEDNYVTADYLISTKKYKFNQNNIIGGITWRL